MAGGHLLSVGEHPPTITVIARTESISAESMHGDVPGRAHVWTWATRGPYVDLGHTGLMCGPGPN
eukprot:359593-Chlamydomonas_euryale.AAC.5